jgi:putative ABC transport system ATP-binding protein
MGPSGSGKSTLLHCLAGLDRLTSSQVMIGDVRLGDLSDKAMTLLRRDRIGFVFQAFNLVPTLTARENVVLPLTLGGKR